MYVNAGTVGPGSLRYTFPESLVSARDNPYMDVTRSHTRNPLPVPLGVLKGIDTVLAGRNLPMLSTHWKDMMDSLAKR